MRQFQEASGEWSGRSWLVTCGDATDACASMEHDSVDCVVTSPPYYCQRDYGVDGQLGFETTPDEYARRLTRVFAAFRPALKPTGTVWLNLGDTYYSGKGRHTGKDAKHTARRWDRLRPVDRPDMGVSKKSLLGVPWRVAFALQTDGWVLRQDIIWHKPGSMPEGVWDRPHGQTEHVFLLTKQPDYHYAWDAIDTGNLWSIPPARVKPISGHYAPFPRELVAKCLRLGCPEGGVVLDPFMGGGTTLLTGLDLGYDVRGVDVNSEYCANVAELLTTRPETLL